MSFIHLHVHSEYSLLQSTARLDALVEEASKRNYPALALTDIDNMHGAVPFYKKCLEKGIKPVIGVELALVLEGENVRNDAEQHRILLLAKNYQGYKSLLKLTSRARTRDDSSLPYITMRELEHDLADTIVISPFENGHIQLLAENGKINEAVAVYESLCRVAGKENVYVEIQNHWRRRERERLLALQEWLLAHKIPTVATNHVHFMSESEVEAHRVLQAVRRGESLSDVPESLTSNEYYFKTESEMKEALPSWQHAFDETEQIAEKCNLTLSLGEPVLPEFPVAEGKNPHTVLKEWCESGLKMRYSTPSEEAWNRLYYELDVILNMNYEDYFLIVADFMNYAHKKGILTGPGRGSAAGSLVAYVLGITDVDPLKYGLLFERFLNPERVSMPDIDIDFADHQRDEMIRYVADKYGRGHVAQIVTFGTLAAKAAVRDAGRALSIEPGKIDRAAKLISGRPGIKLKDAVEENKKLAEMLSDDEELKNLFRIANTIEGLPRHTSIHAAGVVISKEPLTEVVPLQQGHEGLYLTQFPMGDLEEIGLLKMDFLGLRNLTFIERVLNLIRPENVDLRNLPPGDEKTFALLGEGDTSGIFQLESSGMRSVLKRLKPSHFEDIVAVNALYRPGPMDNIPSYINRKHGKETVSYPHADLEKILAPTYGVIIYQEQIMQIASGMAGFSLGEADVLRRAVSKKKRADLEQGRRQFVSGAVSRGYTEEEAEKVYDLIVRFANYGFNRSHAVAYSMISYQLAYLKAHYPLAFISGLMDMSVNHQEKLAEYVSEARRRGIQILKPSILKSDALFKAENGAIRTGLAALKGVGLQTVNGLLNERANGKIDNLFDLCERMPGRLLPRRAIEALIFAGALDDFGEERAVLLASVDDAMAYGDKEREKKENGQTALFFEEESKPEYAHARPQPVKDKLSFEKEVLGFYISGHPAEEETDMLREYGRKQVFDMKNMPDHAVVRACGMVEDVRSIQTKNNKQMGFLRISDESGEMEVTVFPEAYQSYHNSFRKGETLFIEGKIQTHKGDKKIILDRSITVEEMKQKREERLKPVLYIYMTRVHEKKDDVTAKLKELLQDTPGDVPVVIKYESTNKAVRLSEIWNVSGNDEFILKLKGLLGSRNVFLKKPRV